MSTHWFMYRHYDADLDVLVFEAEFEVEVSARVLGGDLQTEVTDVSLEGRSLFSGTADTIELAKKVRAAATAEIDAAGSLWDRVREEEGITYEGRGGNDPDGRWRRVA